MATAITTAKTAEIIFAKSTAEKIAELTQDWLKFTDVQPTTLATYNRALKNFTKWLAENSISEVTREVVISYRDELLENLAPTTCRLYIACVKLFIKFLASKGICPDFTEHFKGVKLSSDVHYRDALTLDESKKLMREMSADDEQTLRNKAIVGLMLATGLRCIEVTRIDAGDIEKRGNKLFLKVHGKGRQGKQDRVILPVQCATLIKSYLACRKNVRANAPLFSSTSRRCYGQRLQAQTISRLCKSALVHAGFISPNLTAHSLRHSFATNAINAGVEIRQVSKALRHKSLVVTEVYLHDLDALNNAATSTVANLIF